MLLTPVKYGDAGWFTRQPYPGSYKNEERCEILSGRLRDRLPQVRHPEFPQACYLHFSGSITVLLHSTTTRDRASWVATRAWQMPISDLSWSMRKLPLTLSLFDLQGRKCGCGPNVLNVCSTYICLVAITNESGIMRCVAWAH